MASNLETVLRHINTGSLGIKSEPSEPVEIGLDDILNSSDEENVPDLDNRIPKQENVSGELANTLARLNTHASKGTEIVAKTNTKSDQEEVSDEGPKPSKRMDPMEIDGLDDILDSSDEEKVADFDNRIPKQENVSGELTNNTLATLNTNASKGTGIVANTNKESDQEEVSNECKTDVRKETEIVANTNTNEESDQEEVSELDEDDSEADDNDFRAVDNLQTGEQLVLNYSKHLHHVYREDKGNEASEENTWRNIYKSSPKTDCRKEMEKVTLIKAPEKITKIEPHEFTILGHTKYVCNHCQRVYKKYSHIQRHIRSIHRDVTNMYQCPHCPYKSKWNLAAHMLFHHKKENEIEWFACHKCDWKFKTKSGLMRHGFTHSDFTGWQCSICPKAFKASRDLKKHVRFVHNKEPRKKISCKECDYKGFPNCMKSHIEVFHTTSEQRRTYECKECDYKTTYEYQLKKHCRKHRKRFCCEKCAFIAGAASHLKLHQITHQTEIDESDLRYRCDKCNYKTYRQYSFNVHKLNHLKPHEIQYFYCYHCDFKAKRKDNLKTHVLRHFKKEEVALQCFVCDYWTKKRTLLTKHLQKHSGAQTQPQNS